MPNYDFRISITGQLSSASIASIRKQINDIGKDAGVKINTKPIKDAGAALKNAKKQSDAFGSSLLDAGKKMAYWSIVGTVLFGTVRAIKDGVQAVVDLDTALVELRKVTDLSEASLEGVVKQAQAVGDNVARTTTEIVKATSSFARMGYSAQEALDLAEQAAMLVNIGDGIDDINTSADAMIATMKGFGMESSDAASILDKLNEVSNNYAVDTSDLAEGITRVSASLAAAGNDLDQTVAMITSATEVIQDSSRASVA